MMNKMTDLVNKIERRLGTKPLKLPEYPKDTWPKEIIIPDSLTTFSRYFPHMVRIGVSTKHRTKDGYFLIDQDLVNGEEIIGVRDIAFDIFGQDSTYVQQAQGLGIYDYLTTSATYSLDDVFGKESGQNDRIYMRSFLQFPLYSILPVLSHKRQVFV